MKIRSVKFNAIINGLNALLNVAFPLITFPYVSRILLPNGYGAAEYALNTAQLFALVAQLGVNIYGVRECAGTRDDKAGLTKVLQELTVIIGLWTIVVTCAYYFFVCAFFSSKSMDAFLVAGLLIPISSLGFGWFMQSMEQYAFMAIRNAIVKILVVIAMFLFVHSQENVDIWVAISVASTGLCNVFNIIFIFKEVKVKNWSNLSIRRHFKPLILFFLMSASILVYTSLDSVMLGLMTNDAQVGYYSVAVKIKNVLTAIIGALTSALLPRLAYYLSVNKKTEYTNLIKLSFHIAIIYAIFVAGSIATFSKPIILTIAGGEYANSVFLLVAIMPSVICISFTQVTSSEILAPFNKEMPLMITYLVAGISDILLNFVLIPGYGALGAAIATSFAEILALVLQMLLIRKICPLSTLFSGCMRSMLISIFAIAIMVAGRFIFGDALNVAVGVILASGMILLVGLYLVREPVLMELLKPLAERFKSRPGT